MITYMFVAANRLLKVISGFSPHTSLTHPGRTLVAPLTQSDMFIRFKPVASLAQALPFLGDVSYSWCRVSTRGGDQNPHGGFSQHHGGFSQLHGGFSQRHGGVD